MDVHVVPISVQRRLRRTLVSIALVGPAYFMLVVASLHLLRRDYDPLRRFLSEYAVGSYGVLMQSAFAALALGSCALLIGLCLDDGPARVSRPGTILLLLWSAGVFVAGLFPTDLQQAPQTVTGIVHDGAALVAVVSMPIGAMILSRQLRRHNVWEPHAQTAVRLAWLALAALVAWPVFGAFGLVGLGQRFVVGADVLWLLGVAQRLRTIPS